MSELSAIGPATRAHLDGLADEVGLRGRAPGTPSEEAHSYATDDICHGIRVDLLQGPVLSWATVEPSVRRGLRFLEDSYDADGGRFRSLRSLGGAWLDAPGAEDTNGRAMLALGNIVADCPDADVRQRAHALFERALPTASQLSGLRARASLLLACDAVERGAPTAETSRVYQEVGNGLRQSFEARDVTFDWPWPEPALTCENALPAHALIVGGARLGYPRMLRMGLRAVEWLLTVQTAPTGHMSLIGDAGGWPRGGVRATADQRPLDATTMLLAADAAWRATGTPRFRTGMEAAYAWYLGANDVAGMLADPTDGVCHDGISADGVLPGQGLEATLMWLTAVEVIRSHRESPSAPVGRQLVATPP